jgi:hypothetical protein
MDNGDVLSVGARVRTMVQSLRLYAYRMRERQMCRTYTRADGSGLAVLGPAALAPAVIRMHLGTTDVSSLTQQHSWRGFGTAAFARRALERFGLVVLATDAVPDGLQDATVCYERWVNIAIPLPSRVEDYMAHLSSDRRHSIRRRLAHGYRAEYVRDPSWAAEFFHRYHQPAMAGRHGDDGYVSSQKDLEGLLARSGTEWVRIYRDNECVGATIGERIDHSYRLHRVGWLDGCQSLYDEDIIGAMYWFALVRAINVGAQQLHVGAVPADLRNGLFMYKQRWGGMLQPLEVGYFPCRLLLDPAHPDARRFLATHALLLRTDTTSFTVVSALAPGDVPASRRQAHLISAWLQLRETPTPHDADSAAHRRLPPSLRQWFAAVPVAREPSHVARAADQRQRAKQ